MATIRFTALAVAALIAFLIINALPPEAGQHPEILFLITGGFVVVAALIASVRITRKVKPDGQSDMPDL